MMEWGSTYALDNAVKRLENTMRALVQEQTTLLGEISDSLKRGSDNTGDSFKKSGKAPHPPRLIVELLPGEHARPMWLGKDDTIYCTAGSGSLFAFDSVEELSNPQQTRRLVHQFEGRVISGVRELDDGSLLVSLVNNENENVNGEVWRSDAEQITWTKVLESSGPGSYIHGSWGMSAYDNIVVLSEYGRKTPPGTARFAYLSTDMGQTFTPIFERLEAENAHVHGSAFDPYRNLIWVTTGDGTAGNRSIQYSQDWGQTWIVVTDNEQPVVPIPMRDCILFGTDGPVNGLLRIRMKDKTRVTADRVEIAYQVDDGSEGLSFIANQPYRRSLDDPLLVGYGSTKVGKTGKILATLDGFDIFEIWSDHIPYDLLGYGVKTILGPTQDGYLIGHLQSGGRSATHWIIKAKAPEWA